MNNNKGMFGNINKQAPIKVQDKDKSKNDPMTPASQFESPRTRKSRQSRVSPVDNPQNRKSPSPTAQSKASRPSESMQQDQNESAALKYDSTILQGSPNMSFSNSKTSSISESSNEDDFNARRPSTKDIKAL